MAAADGDERGEGAPEPAGRGAAQGCDLVAETLPAFCGDGAKQALLVGEVPVGGAAAHTGPCAHIPQGYRVRAALVEQLGGRVEKRLRRDGSHPGTRAGGPRATP